MCQLLGLNCKTPTDATFSFTGFCQRGGLTDHHADGWGIAFFEGRGLRHFVDHQSAVESPVAELIRRYPIKSRNIVAHVRKATQGDVLLENAHPFVRELWGHYWVFAHNGDLKDYHPHLHGSFHPVGTTDSERAFCWLMQQLAKSHAGMPSVEELTLTLHELVPQIRRYRQLQLPAVQRAGAVGTRLHQPVLPGAPVPVCARHAVRPGSVGELCRHQLARRPRRGSGDDAADQQRDLDRVCAE